MACRDLPKADLARHCGNLFFMVMYAVAMHQHNRN